MLYFKATIVGIVSALVTSVVAVIGAILLPVIPFLVRAYTNREGAGIEAVSGGILVGPVLLASLIIGFGGGFYWTIRRARPALRAGHAEQ